MNGGISTERGMFAYHKIPPEHAHLCGGHEVEVGALRELFCVDTISTSGHGYLTTFKITSKHRGDIVKREGYLSQCLLLLPKHMPTPWDMERLATQGVDTHILTAERIMALRIMEKTGVCYDRNGNWQTSTSLDVIVKPYDGSFNAILTSGTFPLPCCGLFGLYTIHWSRSMLNLDTLELVDERDE